MIQFYMFCWLYFIHIYVVLKKESASGPVLFTSCKMVYSWRLGTSFEHTSTSAEFIEIIIYTKFLTRKKLLNWRYFPPKH